MASEQGDQASLPGGIEEWLADHTAETDADRVEVLAQAVESYRLLTDGAGDDALDSRLATLETRLDELETASDDTRVDELEAELDGHVEDLRSRIVDVVKEARSRAPANHSHETLEGRLDELENDTDGLANRVADTESTSEDLETTVDELEAETARVDKELDSVDETLARLESKADKLAGAVVKQRRRIERIESHITHEKALAKLLETAAREGVEKARCDNCNEEVVLSLLAEPACPHCRSVFDDVEPGSLFFNSASLIVADRPALEAGETTDRPFSANTNQSSTTGPDSQ